MTNHPGKELGPRAEAPSEDDARRLIAFQRKCAAVREQTQREIARLESKRIAVRVQWGISSQRMAQWRDEHQRKLQAQQQDE